MSVTLLALEQACGKACEWYFAITPSGVGTSTTVVDNDVAAQIDSDDQAAWLENGWLRCEADSAGTPLNVGETRRISDYAPSTGTLTVSRAFSNASTTTQTYGVWKGVPPEKYEFKSGWKEYINEILTGHYYRRHTLLTLVTDGDMETSGVTNWTNSNLSTMAKVTTAANVAFGNQSLHCVNNSVANGYARSALISVAAGDVFLVRADVQAASGTGVLEAYDQTNSASIETQDSAYRDWRYVWFQFTVPADCHQISIRLKGTETTADIYWDNVFLVNQYTRRLAAPSWLTSENQFEGVVGIRATAGTNDAYLVANQRQQPVGSANLLADPIGATAFWVTWDRAVQAGEALFLQGLSPWTELSATTDTTTADQNFVVAAAATLAGQRAGDEELVKRFGPEYQARLRRLPRRQRLLRSLF